MSALGSSVINKSSKKFGPKQAPIRRGPTSTQTSARPSVDRQLQSQTPQPQHQTPTPITFQPSTPASRVVTNNKASVVSNAAIAPAFQIPKPGSHREASHGQPTESSVPIGAPLATTVTAQHVPASTHEAPIDRPTLSVQEPTNALPCPPRGSPENIRSTAAKSRQPSEVPRLTRPNQDDIEPRAAKRRRVDTATEEASPQTTDAATNIEVPVPTIERNESPQASAVEPAAPSQIYSQPIRRSIEPARPAKIKKSRVSKKAKENKRAIDDAAAEIVADAPRERPRSRKKLIGKTRVRRPTGTTESQQTAEEPAADVVDVVTKTKKPRKKYKRRNGTPDDAEETEIVPSEVTMSQLTGKLRTGRRSSRDKELQVMQAEDKEKKKLAREKASEGTTDEQPAGNDVPTETAEARLERLAQERRRSPSYERAVPNTIIVNGQIQIDESSLVIDRHERAARARDAEAEESVDETENTRRINSASWLKIDKSGGWNEVLTDQFYEGLRMFGTDFNMISKMFPGRTRHSVKLKFNKEEKLNGRKIEATLKGEKIPVDMDEFSKLSNTVFSDPNEVEREIAEDKKRIEDEEAGMKAVIAEAEKERANQAAKEAAAGGEDNSAEEHEIDGEKPDQPNTKKTAKPAKKSKEGRKKRATTSGASSKRAKSKAVTS